MPPHIKAQCQPLTRVLKKSVANRLVVTMISQESDSKSVQRNRIVPKANWHTMNQAPKTNSSNKCSTCVLGQFCIPVGLSNQELEKVDALIKERISLKKGDALYRHGNPMSSIVFASAHSKQNIPSPMDGHKSLAFISLVKFLVLMPLVKATINPMPLPLRIVRRALFALPSLSPLLVKYLHYKINSTAF